MRPRPALRHDMIIWWPLEEGEDEVEVEGDISIQGRVEGRRRLSRLSEMEDEILPIK